MSQKALAFVRRTIRKLEDQRKSAQQYGNQATIERCTEYLKVWREREANLTKKSNKYPLHSFLS